MLEENHEFVQRTLQYVSKINYLIIARTLAEQGHELNRGKMREEFLLSLCNLSCLRCGIRIVIIYSGNCHLMK